MQLDYFQIWHKGRLKAFQAAFVHRYKINTPCTKKAAGALGSVHISSRGKFLAQNAPAAFFALQARFCAQNLTYG